MARFLKKTTKSRGLPPGTLVFIGTRKMEQTRLRMIDYNESSIVERELTDISECAANIPDNTVTWINVDGLHNPEPIEKIGQLFGLDPLMLEDIMDSSQRPKVDEYDNCVFMIMKMLRIDEATKRIYAEQLSVAIGKNFLITFQEQVGDVFEPVRERLRNNRKRIRSSGPDYLAYALLDTVTENYIRITEALGTQVEEMDNYLLNNPGKTVPAQINRYKQEFNYLRRCVRPAYEALLKIPKLESGLIKKHTLPYYDDLDEMLVKAAEGIDTYRDMLSDQFNLYHTTVSSKMNDIMKVLTIFAAIFIPLTFIAGVYGTNFDHVPELHYKYSYFIMLSVMFVIAAGMVVYFRKNKWF